MTISLVTVALNRVELCMAKRTSSKARDSGKLEVVSNQTKLLYLEQTLNIVQQERFMRNKDIMMVRPKVLSDIIFPKLTIIAMHCPEYTVLGAYSNRIGETNSPEIINKKRSQAVTTV